MGGEHISSPYLKQEAEMLRSMVLGVSSANSTLDPFFTMPAGTVTADFVGSSRDGGRLAAMLDRCAEYAWQRSEEAEQMRWVAWRPERASRRIPLEPGHTPLLLHPNKGHWHPPPWSQVRNSHRGERYYVLCQFKNPLSLKQYSNVRIRHDRRQKRQVTLMLDEFNFLSQAGTELARMIKEAPH